MLWEAACVSRAGARRVVRTELDAAQSAAGRGSQPWRRGRRWGRPLGVEVGTPSIVELLGQDILLSLGRNCVFFTDAF
ncbi:hypothetical protein NDU88_003201 [Pleurodeles waltl]|uniref:Uncharacterized protein n=1 Tax=Pleurodeles waltl TaxID=8319 RepID=A0AAV7MTX1_PLEWA|nr:hypothetical protein NDU88_003201 [Pleurodeles waltl]